MKNTGFQLFLLIAFSTSCLAESMRVYIGTYTRKDSKGIYRLELDTETGKLSNKGLAAETSNPSFLALHPKGKHLLAVNENGEGTVSSFRIQDDGTLAFINQQSTGGGAPCHLVIDQTGRHVLSANYSGGNLSVHPIGKDGRLGEASCIVHHKGSSVDPRRQKGPHAHSIDLDPTNQWALSCDLGIDQVLVYAFDAETGKLTPSSYPFVAAKPGAGPRHLSMKPQGRFAYVINEMNSSLTTYAWDLVKGKLEERQTVSTLPPGGFNGNNSTAEVTVHPSGKFVYGSNRGHNSIAVYTADRNYGVLKLVEHEAMPGVPRSFGIDPSGTWLIAAGQNTGLVEVFRIDPETGALSSTGSKIPVPSPVCVVYAD